MLDNRTDVMVLLGDTISSLRQPESNHTYTEKDAHGPDIYPLDAGRSLCVPTNLAGVKFSRRMVANRSLALGCK